MLGVMVEVNSLVFLIIDGRLGLGNNKNFDSPQKVQGLHNIIQVACGDSHTLALDEEGTVFAFGQNSYGQLGSGIDWDDYLEPLKLKFPEKIDYIACGNSSSAAITESGVLYTWGWGKITNFKI